ncbi:hypothetical protein BCR44DRAFT_117154 [Catenaria anguillulae PL171]|uniref:Peroxin-14 n=1 Tax=Catenaria anguillulae PL171 TaxID=765915 RepID=A0A1Y2HK64_9FUNG|nr:hypothetical protein BCR44DRAFT_117154 [Catenaria anguillulae PL171]
MSTTHSDINQSASPPAGPAFDDYDFASDAVFQAGLESILAGITDASEKATATAKAKRFYYARIKGSSSTTPANQATASPPQEAPEQLQVLDAESEALRYPPSFAEIVQMVAEGKPIPGVREIPDKVADAPPSQAALKPRLKPWEAASVSDSTSPSATSS